MKLGKIENEIIILIDVEKGKEIDGNRTEEELYKLGYKKVCQMNKPSENAVERWVEYPLCIVQEWDEVVENQTMTN